LPTRPPASLLCSQSWSSRLTLLTTLGPAADEPEALRSSHSVVRSVPGHTGCVNSLSWEEGGGGRLISAGDDTKRMIREAVIRDWGVELDEGQRLTKCVRRFGVPDGKGGKEVIPNHVVATKLSESNSRDLLVSYSGEAVYLFDTDGETYVPQPKSHRPRRTRVDSDPSSNVKRRRAENNEDLEEEEGWEGREFGEDRPDEMPSPGPLHTNPITATSESHPSAPNPNYDLDPEDSPAPSTSSSRSPSPIPRRRRPDYEPTVPLIAPSQRYAGHANDETVKDVNFAFAGESVVSGSDDGNWFVWEKEGGELKGVYRGDESVVNVLQPHPRLPFVALSGIDNTIKIFGPTTTQSLSSNLVSESETIIRRNKARLQHGHSAFSDQAGQALFNLIAARMPPDGRGGLRLSAHDVLLKPPEMFEQRANVGSPDGNFYCPVCVHVFRRILELHVLLFSRLEGYQEPVDARGWNQLVALNNFILCCLTFSLGLYITLVLSIDMFLDPSNGFKNPTAADRLTRIVHFLFRTAAVITIMDLACAIIRACDNTPSATNVDYVLSEVLSGLSCICVVYTLNARRFLRESDEGGEDDPSTWRGDARGAPQHPSLGPPSGSRRPSQAQTWLNWQKVRGEGLANNEEKDTNDGAFSGMLEAEAFQVFENLEPARLGPTPRFKNKASVDFDSYTIEIGTPPRSASTNSSFGESSVASSRTRF
ncbi:hypothetical protein P7C70_g323, partial [Phenoliferia sp. Uapishka_3]